MMQINISWRHLEPLGQIEEYINKKLNRFNRYSKRINSISVILSKESTRYTTEFEVKLNKAPMFTVKDAGYDIKKVINSCINIAKRKIEDYEKKVKSRKKQVRKSAF